MSLAQKFTSTIEKLEPTKLKITITISPEGFREGVVAAYNKNKHHFNIQGFRKGKAPRKMIEQMYGREVFYEDAINAVLPDAYEAALTDNDIEPVYRPEIEPGPASEDEGAVFYATVYIRPEAEIDEFYGLTYPKSDAEPTEDEILQTMKVEQEKNATQVSVSRPAEMGDVLTINFKGYFGDEPFEGGEGKDFELTLGSKQFIDNFEEQLVGTQPGDDVIVNVKFPDEYHHPDYAGKEAKFEVEVLDVQAKELPELDDEFASNVSDFDTLVEYREDVAKKIREGKEQNLENEKRSHVMQQLVEKATMDVPEAMYLARLDEMMDEFSHQIQRQGMNLETYMRFTQLTPEKLKENWRPQAEAEVKNMLALEAVARKEGLDINDEEFAEYIGKITMQEGDALQQLVDSLPPFRRKELVRSAVCGKAMDFVLDKAIAIDEPLPVVEAKPKKKPAAKKTTTTKTTTTKTTTKKKEA